VAAPAERVSIQPEPVTTPETVVAPIMPAQGDLLAHAAHPPAPAATPSAAIEPVADESDDAKKDASHG
jgi:hypothetical protein